jgi:hypothetical protein
MGEVRATVGNGERQPVATRSAKQKQGTAEASHGGRAIPRTEARTCNQRREERYLHVSEDAQVKFRNRNHKVRVSNVSNNGAMIEADFAPRIGERIQISFEGCIGTDCVVRWVRNRSIGLEFFHETVIVAPAKVRDLVISGRRAGEAGAPAPAPAPAADNDPERVDREPRQSLLWGAMLHWARGSQGVRLRNISTEGAMLEGSEDLADDTGVVLDLGEGGAVSGRVRWSRAGQIGVRFDERYDLHKLARTGSSAPVPSPEMLKPDYLGNELDPASPWAGRWQTFDPKDLQD